MLCLSQREKLEAVPGARVSFEAALAHAGVEKSALDLLELYSCFPAAIQVFADAAGVDTALCDSTVTGGMPFAGGPLNNYVLQATCRMVELLRQPSDSRRVGAVSSVSGMLNKQAWGLWSNQSGSNQPGSDQPGSDQSGTNGFAWLDVSEQVAAHSVALPVLEHYSGSATIAACTVVFQGDLPSRAIVIADTPAGERVLAWSEDTGLMLAMMEAEWCGRTVSISVAGQFQAGSEPLP